jgi:hypothetical protein
VFWMLYNGKREQQQTKKTTQQSLELNIRRHHLRKGNSK